MRDGTRDPGLDALRALAAFAVVVIHVSATAMQRLPSGSGGWWVANLWGAASIWAVPVFVMISGSLLLNPGRTDTAREFLARRAGRILIPLAFWSVVYLGWRFSDDQVTPVQAAVDLFFGMPYPHLWYLFMAAGLYLITPPLRAFVAAADRFQLRYAAGLGLVVGMAANLSGYFVGLPSPLAFLLFVPFVGYYLLGHLIRSIDVRKPLLAGVFVWSIGITAIATGVVHSRFPGFSGWKFLCDQLSPTVMATAVAVYLAGPAMGAGRRLRPAGAWIAPYALGVYVVHPLVMIALERLAGLTAEGLGVAGVPVLSVAVFALSLAAARLIALIPGLRLVIGLNTRD